MLLWYIVHKDINEVDILYFLGRSLLFANSEDINIGVIARILAAFFLYFFINSRILSKSLILYY